MRKRVRKPLAFFMALLLLMSVFGSQTFAEESDSSRSKASEAAAPETAAEASEPEETAAPEGQDSEKEAAQTAASEPAAEKQGVEREKQEYIPEEQLDGVTVRAYAEKGVLPENAEMRVKLLGREGDTADQYKEAEEALKAEEISYDGLLAMDIGFYDSDGNELEPEEGAVNVEIEVDADLLPEDVETDTLRIQHIAETENGVKAETVADSADAADGEIKAAGETIRAEFAVESFSTFTITYGEGWEKIQLTVKYVDEYGDEIDTDEEKPDVSIKQGEKIDLSNYAAEIDGYDYREAVYVSGWNGSGNKTVTHIEAGRTHDRPFSFSCIRLYNGEKIVETIYGFEGESSEIHLVYERTTGPDVSEEKQLTHRKYVELNRDGTYDLNLTVSGAIGSETDKAELDVLLIVDKSDSMEYALNRNEEAEWWEKSRIDAVREAAEELTGTLSGNKKLDVRYSVVTFNGPNEWDIRGSKDNGTVSCGWTGDPEKVKRTIEQIDPDGGTNYEAGIQHGIDQLAKARDNAQKVVIFLTDGMPTVRNGAKACKDYERDEVKRNNQAAVKRIKSMSASAFYCIGAGPGFNNPYSLAVTNLSDLCENVNAARTEVYTADNTDDLNQIFREIAADSTAILCDHVQVVDTLSENVQVVMDGETPAKLVVTVENENGEKVVEPDTEVTLSETDINERATIQAKYENGQIKLLFPENYKLEPNWTYIVTVTIDATETAYEKYREAGCEYPDTGDADTGETSEGKQGVYTNDKATVSYEFNGETREEKYPMPVIQLDPGTLTVEKTISGLDSATEENLLSELTFDITINGMKTSVPASEFEKNKDGVYSYKVEGLSPDTQYKVTESGAEVDSYVLKTDQKNTTGVIPKGESKTARFVNTYTSAERTLTITKKVEGNMGNKEKDFQFTLALKKDGQAYTDNISCQKNGQRSSLASENGKYTFTLRDGGKIVLTLPYGCEYKVEEANGEYKVEVEVESGKGATVEGSALSGTLNEDTSAVFTNTKNIDTPTGIAKAVMPFAAMIVISLGVIVMYIVKRRILR